MSATDVTQLADPLGVFVRFAIVQGRRTGHRVGLTSGLRTNEQQIALRRAHCGTSQFDIYEKAAAACSPPTAKPGSSKHETGNAADLNGDKAWAAGLLRPYGVTRPVAGEDWHFEYKGTDPTADLRKLGATMDALGFTAAEQREVFGPDVTQDENGGALAGVVTVSTKAGSFALSLAKRVPGVGPLVDAGQSTAAALGSVTDVITRLLDPGFWRRIGVGMLGVALIYAGGILLFRQMIPMEVLTNATS